MSDTMTVREVADLTGICKQRVTAKIAEGHYNGVTRCPCGMSTLIPTAEVYRDLAAGTIKRKRNHR